MVVNGVVLHAYLAATLKNVWRPRVIVESIDLSAGLFFGLASNVRHVPQGLLYNLDATVAAGMGILFTTIIVGMLIRRLVR
jgi:hypothetical protein